MEKYNDKNGAILDKRMLNGLFGRKQRTDLTCWELEGFINGTIVGSGFDFKDLGDLGIFNVTFDCASNWRAWWEHRPDKDTWPVVEKHHGIAGWTWFKNSINTSEWFPCFFKTSSNCLLPDISC
jgi:hypothetical protein